MGCGSGSGSECGSSGSWKRHSSIRPVTSPASSSSLFFRANSWLLINSLLSFLSLSLSLHPFNGIRSLLLFFSKVFFWSKETGQGQAHAKVAQVSSLLMDKISIYQKEIIFSLDQKKNCIFLTKKNLFSIYRNYPLTKNIYT